MDDQNTPQIYLLTPQNPDLRVFTDQLNRVFDAHDIACLRLSFATQDQREITHMADTLREICHARDIAVVMDRHVLLVEALGLDGVHLSFGTNLREARKTLGSDAIIGCHCATSRHDGMTAGEAGADYISFGPVGQNQLGDGQTAPDDLFQWWSDMIELPVVAEGGLNSDHITRLADKVDFFAIGDEIWGTDDPVQTLKHLTQGL